jgi:hypothetical protein
MRCQSPRRSCGAANFGGSRPFRRLFGRFHHRRCPAAGQRNTRACRVDTRVLDAPACRTDSDENHVVQVCGVGYLAGSRPLGGFSRVCFRECRRCESCSSADPRTPLLSCRRQIVSMSPPNPDRHGGDDNSSVFLKQKAVRAIFVQLVKLRSGSNLERPPRVGK